MELLLPLTKVEKLSTSVPNNNFLDLALSSPTGPIHTSRAVGTPNSKYKRAEIW